MEDERFRVLGPEAGDDLVEECLKSFAEGAELAAPRPVSEEETVDLAEFLKRIGSAPDDSPWQRDASFFSNLVAVAISLPSRAQALPPFPCHRMEDGLECSGLVEMFASQVPPLVRWRCTVCNDRGAQHNFADLPCDLSGRSPAKAVEEVELTTSEYYTLYENSYLDPRALRTAFAVTGDQAGDHVTMKASHDELRYLLSVVANDARNESDRRRRFEIESLRRALRADLPQVVVPIPMLVQAAMGGRNLSHAA